VGEGEAGVPESPELGGGSVGGSLGVSHERNGPGSMRRHKQDRDDCKDVRTRVSDTDRGQQQQQQEEAGGGLRRAHPELRHSSHALREQGSRGAESKLCRRKHTPR